MAEVARLEAELELAKEAVLLEEARDAMHADRSPEKIATYQAASNKFAAMRTQFRTDFPPPTPTDGDAVATPDVVAVTTTAAEM